MLLNHRGGFCMEPCTVDEIAFATPKQTRKNVAGNKSKHFTAAVVWHPANRHTHTTNKS
ncbi:MAG: hypothetical protein ACQCN6_08630 [Candidatus Bathyarchaeia archaeon]|jgi:hypothetical protein